MYEEVWKTVSTLELVNSSLDSSYHLRLLRSVAGAKIMYAFRVPQTQMLRMYFEYVVGMYSNF